MRCEYEIVILVLGNVFCLDEVDYIQEMSEGKEDEMTCSELCQDSGSEEDILISYCCG